ncbi:MAG: MBL fold metallo-hydrolase [Spirochaetes bacterium]|nr:MBL fold metallo-hydrolase [Spirochaetota bacterium]
MKTRITYICENRAQLSTGMIAEHGLSILIEADETTLYDTGQGLGLIKNLESLEKDIRNIDRVIISHGHYDHVGGLMDLLQHRDEKLKVYLNPDAFKKKVALDNGPDQKARPIGWSFSREEYEKNGAEFIPVEGMARISDSICTFSNIERDAGWKCRDERLKVKENGSIIDDPFNDDLSLLLETESGPVVLLGCAHAGIVEILKDISKKTGYNEFHAVIGGTHLLAASESYIEETIDCLKNYNVKIISPAHCSGFEVACKFSMIFRKQCVNSATGVSIIF